MNKKIFNPVAHIKKHRDMVQKGKLKKDKEQGTFGWRYKREKEAEG